MHIAATLDGCVSSQQVVNDMCFATSYTGKSHLSSLVGVGELVVIYPELMQQGSLEVVDRNRVLSHIPPDLVSFAVAQTTFGAATSHPCAK